MNRENAQALQNANSVVTIDDVLVDIEAKRLGIEIPVAEDLANKIMYFPKRYRTRLTRQSRAISKTTTAVIPITG